LLPHAGTSVKRKSGVGGRGAELRSLSYPRCREGINARLKNPLDFIPTDYIPIAVPPSVSEGRLIKRLQMWGRGAVAGVLAAEMRLQGPAVQAALSRRDSLAPRLLMTSTPSAFVSRRGRMSGPEW